MELPVEGEALLQGQMGQVEGEEEQEVAEGGGQQVGLAGLGLYPQDPGQGGL